MEDFKSFVEQANNEAKEKEQSAQFDPAARIAKFQQRVEEFYAAIDNDWLQSYIADGSIKTEVQEINICEERLGTYPVLMKKTFHWQHNSEICSCWYYSHRNSGTH